MRQSSLRLLIRVLPVVAALSIKAVSAGPAWSERENGLRCRLEADKPRVPEGAEAIFHLLFAFDPKGVDPQLNVLNRYFHPRRVSLMLIRQSTGKVYERSPEGTSGPVPILPEKKDFVPLRGRPLKPERLRVRLFSDSGERLPPGTYSVEARYRSAEGTGPRSNDRDPGEAIRGPWKLWSWSLSAPPITIEVEPAAPEELELKFNSNLIVGRTKNGIEWAWGARNPQTLHLKPKVGYSLYVLHETHFVVGGVDRKGYGGGWGGPLRVCRVWHPGHSTTPVASDLAGRVLAGAHLTVREDVAICETPDSEIRHHLLGRLDSGGAEVLWRGSVEGDYNGKPLVERDPLVDGLRCSLTPAKGTCRAGDALPVALEIRNTSDREIRILSTLHEETLWASIGLGELEQRLTAEPPGLRKQAIVLGPGQVQRVAGQIRELFSSLRLVEPEVFKVEWLGGFLTGDGKATAWGEYRSNTITIAVQPKKERD